jgi:PhzF family phenazine biosynthesis protein
LRFATPDSVISRCGHATLASVADYVLPRMKSLHIDTEWKGRYRIGNSRAEWRARGVRKKQCGTIIQGLQIGITWPERPNFVSKLPARKVYRALGLDALEAALGLPLCVYNSGNFNALVPVRAVATLEQMQPDWRKLKALFEELRLPNDGRLTDLHVYCLRDKKRAPYKVRCRNVFPYGVFEEPATGTASVALATALIDHVTAFKREESSVSFTFDQGRGPRYGKISVVSRPGLDGRPVMWLEGQAFRIMRGTLFLIPVKSKC